MKFNLEALKAYMGAALMAAQENAATGGGLAAFLIKAFEAAVFDIPNSLEGFIATAVAAAIGYIVVYVVPNKKPA